MKRMRVWPLLIVAVGACGSSTKAPSVTPKFDVAWSPGTQVVAAPDGQAHLLPGQTLVASTRSYLFDGQATAIAALQPGQIVVLGGVAYRKVVAVTPLADGTLQLDTLGTTLPEAITSGTLAWSKKVDFGSADVTATMQPLFAGQPLSPTRSGLAGAMTYDGDVQGYHVSLTLTPSGNSLSISLAVKNADETFAISAMGNISGFDVDGQADIGAGGITFQAGSHQMQGHLHLQAAASAAGVSQDLLSIPFGIEIPIELGPVPLILAVKAEANITLALDEDPSSAEAQLDIDFDSEADLTASSLSTNIQFGGSSGTGDFQNFMGGSAAGVAAGMTACLEAPRLELSILGEGPSVALTQNNCASSTFTFSPACNEVRGSIVGEALASLGFFGITLASANAELYSVHRRSAVGDCGPDE
ncbi:MAG TPA: hypothetical protein VGP07_22310 [Polyangia bacterium]|jgi:hypothetical protein